MWWCDPYYISRWPQYWRMGPQWPTEQTRNKAVKSYSQGWIERAQSRATTFEPTRFNNSQSPSLLDLVMSNKPHYVKCIESSDRNVLDHLCVSFQYLMKELIIKPQFIRTRNWSLINLNNLLNHIEDLKRGWKFHQIGRWWCSLGKSGILFTKI